ncbi:hypothetical protein PR003_g28763 [Phytophthora rubi]|uniref:Uncharacterized protein n=1 Tax=Phytophthora rubi TaxID=129364 RepID=A0A6A3HJW0_9STRA|nr:hypothetical protein PR001_g28277 [Phytophthora rubi]KAE8968693.1 hypothetical protein PR002_g27668 [Phytophthora rubi]KAE9277540.1 hypothetical protein PR003_g28763 [Phytophthora rubi]
MSTEARLPAPAAAAVPAAACCAPCFLSMIVSRRRLFKVLENCMTGVFGTSLHTPPDQCVLSS